MDFGLYVLDLVLSLGLGFLTYQDRLFGVAGILTGFLGGAFLYSDLSIVYNSSYSVTGSAVIEYIVPLFIIIVLDIAILLHVSREGKDVLRKDED